MWIFKKKISIPTRSHVAVRMEAIGGQGANSAGKILAEAAVLGMGYSGNHFSTFGSEKRGSAVRSFVRFSRKKEIRSASFIKTPNLLIVFHSSLLKTHPEILEGVGSETDLLINTTLSPKDLRFPKGVKFRNIFSVPATKISLQNSCRLNSILLGASSTLLPEIDSQKLEQSFCHFFQKLPDKILQNNLYGFREGISTVKTHSFRLEQSTLEHSEDSLPRLGFFNAPIGGLITNPGNTVLKNNSVSRKGILPKLDKELCFNCGYCDMVCPDYCFVWEKEGGEVTLKGIDYQFCKGCQKCIVACPVSALVPVLEKQVSSREREVKVFPGVNLHSVSEQWQKADWSQQVADLSEEERMLTIQTELLDANSYIRPDFSNHIFRNKKKKDNE